jgi:N12 class adenine-specific DNA methylase
MQDSQGESFVDRLPADIMNQDATNAFEAKAAERGDKVDSYVERDGRIFQVTKEGLEPVEWQPMPGMDTKAKAAAERKVTIFRQWAKLRDAAVALVKLEANPAADEAEMKNARMLLNQVYDRTVERFGPISKRRFLEDDPEAPLLAALEDEERTTTTDGKVIYTYHKADIFRRRLIEPQEAPTKADTLEEAVSISMAWEGTLNPQYVADLLGTEASLARQKLIEGGHAFEDPSSGLLMTADEYLSGPVSERLRLAQEAAKDSPQYEHNVTALKAALPPHKAISEASIILGQRWIPDSIYTAFLRSIGVEEGEVKFSRELNSFEVRGEGSNEEWNVGSKGAKEIFDAVVNNQTLNYYGYVRGEGMKLDPELTATLHVKADEMRDAFSAFVKTTEQTVADPEYEGGSIAIPDLAERDFNQKVNGIKPPNYVGDWVKLPGQSGIIWLKPFRRAVLARLITQGRGMMAHGVGSGKTYNQIALAMELRRLGKARKPVIVVQNSTINQFAASFRKAYPQAKILVATPRSYNAQTRARFTARMATGDWDAIILTHSNIDLIPQVPGMLCAVFLSSTIYCHVLAIDHFEFFDFIDEAKNLQ